MKKMKYDYNEECYIGKNPSEMFEVEIWGMVARIKTGTKAQARYAIWTEFHDVYDLTFGEFIKQAKVKIDNGF